MYAHLNNLVSLFNDNSVFIFCALTGAGMLIIQFVLNLFGLVNGESLTEHDVCVEKKLNVVSLQAVAGFLMMFGLTALTCRLEFQCTTLSSILVSFMGGFCAIVIFNLIFKIARLVQSTGSVYKINGVIGKEAYVYQRIPKDGTGKISISFQDLTYEIDAISHTQHEIPSFTRVQIIKKRDDSTVVVVPV